MIVIKTKEEIELMRESALIVSKTLGKLSEHIRDGVTPKELDSIAEDFILGLGAKPGFKGMYGCPSTLLTSVNDVVVHGLPTDIPLKDGDIVSIDCGSYLNGYYGDHAYTFSVGSISDEAKKLLEVTKQSLYLGIEQFISGNRVGDISNAIQSYVESNGFSVVRELTGHGLGKDLHEDPNVPNFGRKGQGKMIKEGMVFAIEPMINYGEKNIYQDEDGWTLRTKDGSLSAHFEHDVAIIDGNPEILSTFDYIESNI